MILITLTYINLQTNLMFLIINMKSISSSQRDNILVLSISGLSIRQITSKTCLGKSRVINQNIPNKENAKL